MFCVMIFIPPPTPPKKRFASQTSPWFYVSAVHSVFCCEEARKHMCVTDRHDVTLAVKVVLNPNTTNQPNSWQRAVGGIPFITILSDSSLNKFIFMLDRVKNLVTGTNLRQTLSLL